MTAGGNRTRDLSRRTCRIRQNPIVGKWCERNAASSYLISLSRTFKTDIADS
jgi:hypothetical protein